ncbi:MAG: toxin [Elusimicrobia bacterium]|nr:toxin [Elusimicrobiota bacterium]
MSIRWDPLKNEWLKRTRGISFEDILRAPFVAIEQHPKRPNQKLMLFEREGYIWVVPYVENGEEVFLKTLFPSRMYTKKWIRGELE